MVNATSQRLHGLDAVRAGALLLGIFFHATFSFFPGDQFWVIADAQRSGAIATIAFPLHMFRMTIFFLLSGYFGRMHVTRLGAGHFIRDRFKRIGLPLIIFWPILMVCFIALGIWGMIVSNGGVMPENPPASPPFTLQSFPLTHLWFLYVLLLFYGSMLVVRFIVNILDRMRLLRKLSDTILERLAHTPLLPFLLAIPIAYAFVIQPNWPPYFGVPTPDYGFAPNRIALIAYGSAFTLGWLFQRQAKLLSSATHSWPFYLVVAITLTAFCLAIIFSDPSHVQSLSGQVKIYYALAYALAIWFWTFGLIGFSLKIWSRESIIRRYIADASYWLYIVHLPIVMALQIWVSRWDWPAEQKYLMILLVSISIMLMSYHFFVRYSVVGGLLNGRRRGFSRQKELENTS